MDTKNNNAHHSKEERCDICGNILTKGMCSKCGWVQIIFPNIVPPEIAEFNIQRKNAAKNLHKKCSDSEVSLKQMKEMYETELSKNKKIEQDLNDSRIKEQATKKENERNKTLLEKANKELSSLHYKNQGLVDNVQSLTSQNQSLKRKLESIESCTCKAGELSFKEMNGIKYCGDISVDNERSGFGICKKENESYYAGEWKLDMRNGIGMEVNSVNSKYVGEWNFNRKNGIGTTIQTDGIRYSGEWKNGKMHGVGTLFYPNGERLCARFSNGLLQQGTGVYYLQDGSCIIGRMTMNGPDGKCLHYKNDGFYENEIWNNGIKY